ncbi:MAG: 50S ribosomal protein L19 [Candidatus Paceibacterota bacterium]|jgi:large subunit ribosomal protein L19
MRPKVISTVNTAEREKLDIRPGDLVRVWQKIEEDKGKSRLQAFEGLVLAHKHGTEAGATFTVRKVVDGVGVERIFPLYSPMIDEIELVRRSKVRRAKLYFIRRKAAKEIRHQMRRIMAMREEPEEVAPVSEAAPVETAPTTEPTTETAK